MQLDTADTVAVGVTAEDDTQPRPPPLPPTPAKFPLCPARKSSGVRPGLDASTLSSVERLATSDALAAFNVYCHESVDPEILVPARFIPPPKWEHDPASSHGDTKSPSSLPSTETLSSGAAVPSHEAYWNRRKELLYDTEDVYHALARVPATKDRKPVKVLHFRRFWTTLKIVGTYWDTSLDRYFDVTKEQSPGSDMATKAAAEAMTGKNRYAIIG